MANYSALTLLMEASSGENALKSHFGRLEPVLLEANGSNIVQMESIIFYYYYCIL